MVDYAREIFPQKDKILASTAKTFQRQIYLLHWCNTEDLLILIFRLV